MNPLRLFITGTDTNVGKTHVTCLIARQMIATGYRVAGYKPVCSGAVELADSVSGKQFRWEDIERIRSVIGDDWSDDEICPQRFIAPVAPPIAARLEGKSVDFSTLMSGASKFFDVDLLLIEGAGGWLSPMTDTKTVGDVAQEMGAPVLIVSRVGLGTINHTLLTIESIRRHRLRVAGIVLNQSHLDDGDLSSQTNSEEIEARSGVPVLGTIPYGNTADLFHLGRPVAINWRILAAGD